MNRITKTITAGTIMIGIVGCSTATNIATLLNSAVGQSFITALGTAGTLIPGLQAVITQVDNGITGNGTVALETICFALPWADGAVDFFGPAVKIPATTISEIDAAVASFKMGPCTNPPTNLASVLGEGVALFIAIETDLNQNNVPVVAPPSATIIPMIIPTTSR